MSVERISREELNAKLDRGEDVELVEVLGEARYKEAHLPGAPNIPYDRVNELAPRQWQMTCMGLSPMWRRISARAGG